MTGSFRVLLASLLATMSLASHGDTREPSSPLYVDLTTEFALFFDETVTRASQPRAALFRERMNALLPGFYAPRNGGDPARYDARVAEALDTFAALRPRFELVQREFPRAFETGIRHFRKSFPGFTPNVPVYLVHSLGEMDGGTREFDGRVYLIFGADVIAQIHDTKHLTSFLDHELFHVEHGRHFPECGQVWCAMWAEGLATYAAKVMNPGADDAQLLLTTPEPIRAKVDATWPNAVCFTRAKLDSSAQEDMTAMFQGGREAGDYPRRFAYYIGLRVAEEAARRSSLADLAKLPPERARQVMTASLDRLISEAGGCR